MADIINIQSEDKDIIESFKKGNKNAFNILVLKYQSRIYWLVRRFVLDHDDANDLTQEIFLKLYNSLNNFRGDSTFFTYIYRISVNICLNHLKKNKVIAKYIKNHDSNVTEIKSDEKNSEEIFDNQLNEKIIKRAIQTLPEQQKAVFTLRFYEELSYDEIASILDTTVGGLKANYFHAFKKIQSFLQKEKNKIY